MDESLPSPPLFEVETPIGFCVRVTTERWRAIVETKHPVMLGCESDVQLCLTEPDEVRRSSSDPEVYLFYRTVREHRWVCCVCKQIDADGFLITAYPTDAINEGFRIWPT